MQKVSIHLENSSYPIIIGKDLLADGAQWLPLLTSEQVFILSDENVAPFYLQQLQQVLHGRAVEVLVLPAGEAQKSLQVAEQVYTILLQSKFRRDMTVVALGGGVIGDLAGFVAATYMRGVKLIHVPTSLIAQADASIGGKVAVNHPLGKNLIGTFHQPRAVLTDVNCLQTLPAREFHAGMAEVIKHGMIHDAEFMQWLSVHADHILQREVSYLETMVVRCAEIKAYYVEQDVTDQMGKRALLNFGHTFGHALERWSDYRILHGEAVAIGMVLATKIAQTLGYCESATLSTLCSTLGRLGLPCEVDAQFELTQLLETMVIDKKVMDNGVNLVLPTAIGHARLVGGFSKQRLAELMRELSDATRV